LRRRSFRPEPVDCLLVAFDERLELGDVLLGAAGDDQRARLRHLHVGALQAEDIGPEGEDLDDDQGGLVVTV